MRPASREGNQRLRLVPLFTREKR